MFISVTSLVIKLERKVESIREILREAVGVAAWVGGGAEGGRRVHGSVMGVSELIWADSEDVCQESQLDGDGTSLPL